MIDVGARVGGTGDIASEPSGNTVAAPLASWARPIGFSQGATSVPIFYTAGRDSSPIWLNGFDGQDGTGNATATTIRATAGKESATCLGGPNGTFNLFDVVTITRASDSTEGIGRPCFVARAGRLLAVSLAETVAAARGRQRRRHPRSGAVGKSSEAGIGRLPSEGNLVEDQPIKACGGVQDQLLATLG